MMKKLVCMLIVTAVASSAMAIFVPDASLESAGAEWAGSWDYVETQYDSGNTPWNSTYYSGSSWVGNNYYWGDLYPGVGRTGDTFIDLNASYIHQSLSAAYVEGEVYELSGWFTTTSADQKAYLYFTSDSADGWTDATTLDYGSYDVPVQADLATWVQFSFEYTATAADAGKGIGIAVYGRSITYADDFAVAIVPEPMTLGLLGLGALCLRKKKRC